MRQPGRERERSKLTSKSSPEDEVKVEKSLFVDKNYLKVFSIRGFKKEESAREENLLGSEFQSKKLFL